MPRQDSVAIIHGDYRIDNVIFAAERPEVLAVVDWELSMSGELRN
jgi:aminoglycoside phosphotransferase (APT) family kinase protein